MNLIEEVAGQVTNVREAATARRLLHGSMSMEGRLLMEGVRLVELGTNAFIGMEPQLLGGEIVLGLWPREVQYMQTRPSQLVQRLLTRFMNYTFFWCVHLGKKEDANDCARGIRSNLLSLFRQRVDDSIDCVTFTAHVFFLSFSVRHQFGVFPYFIQSETVRVSFIRVKVSCGFCTFLRPHSPWFAAWAGTGPKRR